MTDLTKTIEPKSDQLNADDLIVGPMTITIREMNLLSGEQPISVGYEGDNGKPYKPCKSMRRVMVSIWGSNGNEYIGKSMTLFRDQNVRFGSDAVGGIRISHMSHIDEQVSIALTMSRGKRKPYIVSPLKIESVNDIREKGVNAAHQGMDKLKEYWESLSVAHKHQMKNDLVEWKKIAEEME